MKRDGGRFVGLGGEGGGEVVLGEDEGFWGGG